MWINGSNVEHAIIAVLVQLLMYCLPGVGRLGIWGCGASAVAIFLGREIAQNEYWWAARYSGWHYGQPLDIPWYAGLFSPHWHLDSVMDVLCPLIACAAVAVVKGLVDRSRT